MYKDECPDKPGIYTLIIDVTQPGSRTIGKLGCRHFEQGIYTYTGSALGRSTNLRNRVNYHLRSDKKNRWHTDYLLNSNDVILRATVYIETYFKRECQVANKIELLTETKVTITGFGSSDCNLGCAAHLHYFPYNNLMETIAIVFNIYKQVFQDTTDNWIPKIILFNKTRV